MTQASFVTLQQHSTADCWAVIQIQEQQTLNEHQPYASRQECQKGAGLEQQTLFGEKAGKSFQQQNGRTHLEKSDCLRGSSTALPLVPALQLISADRPASASCLSACVVLLWLGYKPDRLLKAAGERRGGPASSEASTNSAVACGAALTCPCTLGASPSAVRSVLIAESVRLVIQGLELGRRTWEVLCTLKTFCLGD